MTEPIAGKKMCYLVNGDARGLNGGAIVAGKPVGIEILAVDGKTQVCFKIPKGAEGATFELDVTNSRYESAIAGGFVAK